MVETLIKTFVFKKNDLKSALKRAIKSIRFLWSASTKNTPFKMCFGRKPRSVLTNIFNLKTEGKYLIESILNKTGNQLTQIHLTAKSMESIQKDRNFGKSAETEDLRKEMRRRKVSQLRFSIVEKTNRCALTSKFEVKIRKLVGETVHTVSD